MEKIIKEKVLEIVNKIIQTPINEIPSESNFLGSIFSEYRPVIGWKIIFIRYPIATRIPISNLENPNARTTAGKRVEMRLVEPSLIR